MEGDEIKRILMTTDTVGGVWTYSMVMARQLAAYNIEVCLVTLGKKMSVAQQLEVASIAGLRVFESNYKLEWMEDPWDDLQEAGRWLLQLEEELEPDIIHLNSYAFAPLPWITPVLMVCHSCVYTWWQNVKGVAPDDQWLHYYGVVKQALKTTDRLVAVSHTYALDMAHCYDIPLEQIHVIYNGLHPGDYYAAEKKEVVFGTGRIWDEGKNYRIAEAIAPHVAWPIVLAGDTADRQLTVATHAKSSESGEIVFMGRLGKRQVAEQLAEASIYMLPSLYEPFGLAALEAAFSKCALVLADIPTLREIWQESALYAPPGRPEKWAEQINKLIDDENLRKYLGEQAYETASRFTAERMAGNYLALYKEIFHSNILSV